LRAREDALRQRAPVGPLAVVSLVSRSEEARVCRVKAYVGQTRARELIAELVSHGIGECFRRKKSR